MYGLVLAIVFVALLLWGGYTVFRIYQKSQAEKIAREQELNGGSDDYDNEDL